MSDRQGTESSILIVDDEEGIRVALANLFRQEGFRVQVAGNRRDALDIIRKTSPDTVLLDIRLGGDDGIGLLKEIKKELPETVVVMITGHGSINSSVRAMKDGAADYILKPLDNATVLESVRRNLELRALRTENSYLKSEIRQVQEIRTIKSANSGVQAVLSIADRVKNTPASVLITGESGSGKELLARYIHFTGNRRSGNFVGVNCAALSESLLLSELFGHEKGAFTGATEQRPGKFEMAHKGTLFLDEIGDMSMEIQSKILRVLEERSFERVGGVHPIGVDVRIIAATNRNLEELIRTGNFRNDLYYRLKVISCELPPLRNRPEDIPILIDEFIAFYNERYGKEVVGIDPILLNQMKHHRWPGNIRELRNMINQAILLADRDIISHKDIGAFSGNSPAAELSETSPVSEARGKGTDYPGPSALKNAVEQFTGEFEAEYISEALVRNHGNKSRTAEDLGISRKTLSRKMERYRL